MSKNVKVKVNKREKYLFEDYDVETSYMNNLENLSESFVDSVFSRSRYKVNYMTKTVEAGNQFEVEIYDVETSYMNNLENLSESFVDSVFSRSRYKVNYMTKTVEAGNQFEVEIYPVFKSSRDLPDGIVTRKKETRQAQKNLNDANSRKKLTRLVHANFGPGDYWITFTFSDEHLPKNFKEMEKIRKNYFGKINRLRKKKGLANARYIYVEEEGTYGTERFHIHLVMDSELTKEEVESKWTRLRKKKGLANARYIYVEEEGTYGTERFHIHLVMDSELTKEEVESKWTWGRANIRTINYNGDESLRGLCNYMVKDPKTYKKMAFRTKGKRTWGRSKGNLKEPVERKNKTKFSRGLCNYMVKDPKTYKKMAFRTKGKRTWGRSKGNLKEPVERKNKTKFSRKKVLDMAKHRDGIGEILNKSYPGRQFKEVEVRYNDYNGLFYIYAIMHDKRNTKARR